MNISAFRRLAVSLVVVLLLQSGPALAQGGPEEFKPVDATYMVRDPSAPGGYAKKAYWTVNSVTDWARFYNRLPTLPVDNTMSSDPLNPQVEDVILFTQTDSNGLTGYDIYLSAKGIMAINRGARHTYYPDLSKLWTYLRDEQKQRASYDKETDDKISRTDKGIVITYYLSDSIPNPMWKATEPEEIKLYASFLKGLKPMTGEARADVEREINFDVFGSFILNLNYPGAPGSLVTIGPNSVIRISRGQMSMKFYEDPQDYYRYFKMQALELMEHNERQKKKPTEKKKVVPENQF